MSNFVIRRSSPLQVAMNAPVPGPRLVVAGKQGPKFEQPRCSDCRDFQVAKVRIDGQLVEVRCDCTGSRLTAAGR